jgi:uncharacterized protein YjiS (DUF1127 family)
MTTVPMRSVATETASPSLFASLIAGIARLIEGRRAAAELTRLDGHILADIGLTREDVLAAFERPMIEDPTIHLANVVRERRAATWY